MIIDTSVAAKWILAEEHDREKAKILLQNHVFSKEQLTVPNLLFFEIANLLATKTAFPTQKIKKSIQSIFDANLNIYYPTQEEIILAALWSKKYKTTVYDMLYAIIAKEKATILVTADENFIKKTGFKFVKHLSEIEIPEEPEAVS